MESEKAGVGQKKTEVTKIQFSKNNIYNIFLPELKLSMPKFNFHSSS